VTLAPASNMAESDISSSEGRRKKGKEGREEEGGEALRLETSFGGQYLDADVIAGRERTVRGERREEKGKREEVICGSDAIRAFLNPSYWD